MEVVENLLKKDISQLEEEEVRALENELTSWSVRTEDLRSRLEAHGRFHKDKQKEELRESLKNIDERVEEEHKQRLELEKKLQELRNAESGLAVESDTLEKQLDGVDVQDHLEEIALLRIKADRVRREINLVQTLEDTRKIEIDAISEENSKRTETGAKTLNRLLHKVSNLQEELQRPEYQKNGEGPESSPVFDLDVFDDNEEQFSRLIDKVTSVREMRWEERVKELERDLVDLCVERDEISKQEVKVRHKRKEHMALVSKGVDFLVEMELGNVPPAEFILKNANEEEKEDLEELLEKDQLQCPYEETTLEDLFDHIEREVQSSEKQIVKMKREQVTLEEKLKKVPKKGFFLTKEVEPYNGSLGRESYPANKTHIYDLVKDVLVECLSEALNSESFNREHAKVQAKSAVVHWEASRKALLEQIAENDLDAVIREAWGEMTDRVIATIISGIFGELDTASSLAARIARNMVLGAVFGMQRDVEVSDTFKEQVENTFSELQKRRQGQFKLAYVNSRIPPTKISLKLEPPILPQEVSAFYSANAAYNVASMHKIKEELDRRKKQERELEAELDEQRALGLSERKSAETEGIKRDNEILTKDESSEDEDEGLNILDFSLLNLVDCNDVELHAPGYEETEKRYWNNINFRSKHIQVQHRAFGYPSAMAFSATGDFLAVGTSTGCILVYDLRPPKEALLLRKYQERSRRAKVSQVVWPLDAGSQLATLDELGYVSLFSTLPAPGGKKKSFAKEYKPESLTLLLSLESKDFARPVQQDLYGAPEDLETYRSKTRNARQKKKRKRAGLSEDDELFPVNISFHSSHSLFGVQSSLLVALSNGAMVKWNVDHVAGDRSVHCPVHAQSEPTNPQNKLFQPGVARDKGALFGSTICREFLQEHDHPVLFSGHVHRCSELLYSVDSKMRMNLWAYTPKYYSGFGWYLPKERFALKLDYVTFNADKSVPVEEQFPPSGVQLPSAPERVGKGKPAGGQAEEDDIFQADQEFMRLQEEEKHYLESLELAEKPWLTKAVGEAGRYMQIFSPKKYQEGKSSPHQVVIFSKGGILLKRMVSAFSPIVFHGLLVDISFTMSGAEIVFLVQYPGSTELGPTIRMYIYDTHTLEMRDEAFELSLEGNVLPRFSISPILGDLGSDFAYVLMNNEIHVVSLTTGEYVCRKLCPIKNESKVKLTEVHVSRDHGHLGAIGVGSDTVYLFAIENQNEPGSIKRPSEQDFRPRLCSNPSDCEI